MSKRWKMSSKRSHRDFTRKAQRVHPKNSLDGSSMAMRGGIRL